MNSTITADIKNLSIALEAFSRFPGSTELAENIKIELDQLVYELARRRRKAQEAHTQNDIPDNDIPF